MRRAGALLALLALVFLAAACGEESTGGGSGNPVAVTITPEGCPAELEVPAGETTFKVTNDGADAVTEFEVMEGEKVLGEAENVAPGLSGEFTLDLEAGEYTTYCPGGSSVERGKLTVTG